MTWLIWLVLAAVVIVGLAIVTMFMGRGHLDEHNTEGQHLDEVEIFSRNFHF